MVTISRALQLVYNFSEKQAQDFLVKHKLDDEHENPFLAIEERVTHGRDQEYYWPYDWIFCVLCREYRIEHVDSLKFSNPFCHKCGGSMV